MKERVAFKAGGVLFRVAKWVGERRRMNVSVCVCWLVG